MTQISMVKGKPSQAQVQTISDMLASSTEAESAITGRDSPVTQERRRKWELAAQVAT